MDANEWITATGGSYMRRGGSPRPANPKLVRELLGKSARPARPRDERLYRRLVAEIARSDAPITAPVVARTAASRRQIYLRALRRTAPADRPGGGDTSIYAQSQVGPAGAAARMQHQAAVQRFRKPF